MGMTLAEKVLANHAVPSTNEVKAGDLVYAKVDLVMGTDIASPLSIDVFEKLGAKKVFDKNKIALVNDHLVPAKDIKAAQLSKMMREFAYKFDIKNYFEVGRSGICHTIVPDKGLVGPGDLVVGADSHTCTYGAVGACSTGVGSTDLAATMVLGENWFRVPETIKIVFEGDLPRYIGGKDLILNAIKTLGVDGARYRCIEFAGPVISRLPMADRFTICNMAIEAGAKFGVIAPDEVTMEYMNKVSSRKYTPVVPDPDAEYIMEITIDVSALEPQIAVPYSPSNVFPISQIGDVRVDQVVVGSCTNGRIEDFRMAAEVLGDKQVHPRVRLIIIPGTQEIALQLINEGLAEKFIKAGAVISPPTCGPCIGAHMGILADEEVGLYTTNRNFRGRNGHTSSRVYLAGPAVAGATAITGKISDPR
ncbi:3-isopropylmalate dehydratase large subunit [candidate division KSB1 bacterium]